MYILQNSSSPGEIFYEWHAFMGEQPKKQDGLILKQLVMLKNEYLNLANQWHIELPVLPCGNGSYKLPVKTRHRHSLRYAWGEEEREN